MAQAIVLGGLRNGRRRKAIVCPTGQPSRNRTRRAEARRCTLKRAPPVHLDVPGFLRGGVVLGSLMGARKTVAYVALVVIMATLTGLIYGALVG